MSQNDTAPDGATTESAQTAQEPAGAIPVPGLTSQAPEGDLGGLKAGTEEYWPSGRKKYPSEKRRRKKGPRKLEEPLDELQAPPPQGMPPEEKAQVATGLALTFGIVSRAAAASYGKHWELAPEESQALGEAWAEVAALYMQSLGKAGPWGMALLATFAVLGPKYVQGLEVRVDTAGKPLRKPEPEVSGEVVKDAPKEEETVTAPAPQHPPTAGGGPILPPKPKKGQK